MKIESGIPANSLPALKIDFRAQKTVCQECECDVECKNIIDYERSKRI